MSGHGLHRSGFAALVTALLTLPAAGPTASAADGPSAKEHPIVILVATFDGPGDAGKRVADTLASRIQAELKDHRSVEVRRLAEVISEAQGTTVAWAKGRQRLANYFVWGRCATAAAPVEVAHLEWTHVETTRYVEPGDVCRPLQHDSRLFSVELQARAQPANEALVNLVAGLVLDRPQEREKALSKLEAVSRLVPAAGMPRSALLNLARGQLLQDLGRIDQALSQFDQAVERLPDCPDLYLARAGAREDGEDYDGAIRDYDRGERLGGDKIVAQVNRAQIYFDRGELERALSELNAAVKLDAKSGPARTGRGAVHFAQGEFDLALADLTEAIHLTPAQPRCYFLRALVYTAKQQWDRALADCSEAIQVEEEWAAPYFVRGQAYLHLDDLPRALADCDRGVQLDPRDAKGLTLRGQVHSLLGHTEAARADYAAAMKLDPAAEVQDWARERMRLKQPDFGGALSDLPKAVRHRVDNEPAPAPFGPRGKSAQARGKPEQGRADRDQSTVRALVDLIANEPEPLKKDESAQALAEQALPGLNRGVELNPKDPVRRYRRARVYLECGNLLSALEDLNAAIEQSPDYVDALFARGDILTRFEQPDRAIPDLEKVIERVPAGDKLRALEMRAHCYHLKADFPHVIADRTALIRLEPRKPQNYAHRALAHELNGDRPQAIADFKKARDLAENPAYRAWCEEHLVKLERPGS